MPNLNSYIISHSKWRIGFFHPLNDVDAMVFARFSYLPFSKIKMDERETVGSICTKMSNHLKIDDYCWPDDYEFVNNLKNARRFKNKRVSDYKRVNNRSIEKQFSAITIHLNHFEMYLSFFGTDDSITGWKEDFNLAFLDHIPAQTEAQKYLETLRKAYPLKKMRLGGHSKGGNLAIYASVTADDAVQKRMLKVYNFDGPGLRKGTAALDTGTEKVINKIHSFIPQGSVIGRLFEHNEKVTVVKSGAKNLYQHDIYSWQVRGNRVVESKTTKASDLADKTITKWLETASKDDQKVFINSMFKVLASADINSPLELRDKWFKAMPTMLKTFHTLPKEKKKVVMAVWKKLGSSFLKARKGDDAD